MAVHGEHGLVDVRDAVHQLSDDAAELGRNGVADGVGDVDRRGARGDGLLDHAAEVVDRRATRVLAGELNVIGVLSRLADRRHAHGEHVVKGLPELVLHVYRGGGDEGVYAEALRGGERLAGGVHVLEDGTREAAGNGGRERAGDRLHRLEVALRGDGEARLDDVNAELLERQRDLQLLSHREALGKGLLAVAQSGVKDDYSVL